MGGLLATAPHLVHPAPLQFSSSGSRCLRNPLAFFSAAQEFLCSFAGTVPLFLSPLKIQPLPPSSTKKGLSLHPLVSSTLGQATPVPLRHEVSHSLRKGNILSSPLRESQGPRELLFNGPGVPFIAIGIIDGNAY